MAKKAVVTFFVAQYTSIDPNVSHPYDEFEENVVLTTKNDIDDAAKLFGMNIDVVMHDFLYDDIQKAYLFSRKPSFVGMSCGGHMFYDGTCARVIDPANIDAYMKKWIEKYIAYEKEQQWHIKDTNGLVLYLCESFMTEKGFVPRKGVNYLLSASQVQEIDKREKSLNLSSLYDCDEPNIFVSIST